MTDISVIKMIISVAVWRIYPSWCEWQVASVGGTRPLRNVLGEALEGRFSFEARNYLFSCQSYARFEEFFCFPCFWKIWRQMFKLWGFWFRRCLRGLFENSAPSLGTFCELQLRPQVFFGKFSFFSPKQSPAKQSPVLLAWQLWRSPVWAIDTVVMVHRKQEWKLDFWAWATSSAEGPSIVVAIGTGRVRWSIVQKKKKKHKEISVWLKEVSTLHHPQTSELWGACFRDPMSLPFRTSLLSWTWMYSCGTVMLQRGESEEKQSSVTFPVLITEA